MSLLADQASMHCCSSVRTSSTAVVGQWYDWPLTLLECDSRRETWGKRSLIEAWFSLLKYRTMLFWHRFLYQNSHHSTDRWLRSFATLHKAIPQT